MDDQGSNPANLTGTADERLRQLAELSGSGELSAKWLRRQLDSALSAWAGDESALDIDAESRVDF